VVREERPVSLAGELFATIAAGCAAFWRALSGRPADAAPQQPRAAEQRRRSGEPSV
jgi:hypothetical protein